jgi:hypothetical protein
MPAWGWTILKWTVALAAMAVVVYVSAPLVMEQVRGAISFGGDDDTLVDPIVTEEPESTPTRETEEATARALVAVGARSGIVEDPAAPEVTVGPGAADELLIAFEPLPTDPACLTGVVLQVQLLESTETSVYVQPARVPDLRAIDSGGSLPANWQVGDVEPSRAFTTGAPGGLRWDVQEAYSLAAREAQPGTNVVLSITTPPGDPDRATLFATGADLEERLPFIEWAAIAGCDGLGTPGDGATPPPDR